MSARSVLLGIPIFLIFHMFKRELIGTVPDLTENLMLAVFLDTVEARSFKLCMTITLCGICWFIPGFMTLTCLKVMGVSEMLTADCAF